MWLISPNGSCACTDFCIRQDVSAYATYKYRYRYNWPMYTVYVCLYVRLKGEQSQWNSCAISFMSQLVCETIKWSDIIQSNSLAQLTLVCLYKVVIFYSNCFCTVYFYGTVVTCVVWAHCMPWSGVYDLLNTKTK